MQRRSVLQLLTLCASLPWIAPLVHAKTYLTVDQARQLIYGDLKMAPWPVTLTKEQARSIRRAAKVIVRNRDLRIWRSERNDLFLVDRVIGKHENIDYAVGIDRAGEVKGIEILVYRETYGYEIMNAKWRAQFQGRDHQERLRLDRQIKNIAGATLSCRHITDGINRLTQTWVQVLQPRLS